MRSGTLALVGKPNVGKSTLLNQLVGEKISITSRKAQTTRATILGVLTTPSAQFVFMDTPGFQNRFQNALYRGMNQNVKNALLEVDVVIFLVEAAHFDDKDAALIPFLPQKTPVILAIFLMVSVVSSASPRSALLISDAVMPPPSFCASFSCVRSAANLACLMRSPVRLPM